MRTSALSTKKNNAVLKKSAWKVMKNNGYLFIVVVAIGLSFGNNEWVEALSILGNNGAYSEGIPSLGDLGQMVDRVEDELIGHDVSDVPDSLDEDIPHPIRINNWASDLKVGQIGGVAVNPSDQPVIFHRGTTEWGAKTFNLKTNNLNEPRAAIDEDTILTLDPDNGKVLSSWGKGMFYMPHGLTIDSEGNTYVTDVGLHQVMRFPAGQTKPDLILGVAFESGHDEKHFCKPTDVAVSEKTGDIFVSDGYCNSRILKFSADGRLKQIIDGDWTVPHSLALFEESDVLCVANREGQKIDCMKAGIERPLYANRDETGQKVTTYTGVGRPYAIDGKGTALLTMSGSPNIRGLTIDTASDSLPIIDEWAKNDNLASPHDIAVSLTGDAIYVAEITPGKGAKLQKYDVMAEDSNDLDTP